MYTVFWRFTNHYKIFIHKYAHIARPLNVLMSGKNANRNKLAINWNDDCEKSFQVLKHICSSIAILFYADYSKPFKLHTDVSNFQLGAVLYQTDEDGLEKVIAYANKALRKSKRKYTTYK